MFITKQQRLNMALDYLQNLIAKGVEYPDAQWKACSEFNVSGIELQAMYDNGH